MEKNNKNNLPKNWSNVRLEDVSIITLGQSPPSSTYNKNGDGLPFFQGKTDFGQLHPTTRLWCSSPKKIAENGDILISVRAPVGPTNISIEKCCIGRGLASIRPKEGVDLFFIFYQIRSIEDFITGKGKGTTFKAITGSSLKSIPMKFAPISEQKRIVAKIEELFSLIDNSEKNLKDTLGILGARISKGKNLELNDTFDRFRALKMSILKQAFEGKLVPQETNDDSI